MRTLVVGDIHGCFTALRTLMEAVAIRPEDRLIALGDYIDRGPDSRQVIEWLIGFGEKGSLIALRGNHEAMALDARVNYVAREDWLACGGKQTLASYAPADAGGGFDDIPDSHWRFLEETRLWHEADSHFFVHANAYPDMPLEDQPEYMLLWEKFRDPPPHFSGKVMVCGHTPQKSGEPKNIGHAICLDTWVYGDGWLTCLDLASGRTWQANQRGQTRQGSTP